MASTVDPDTRVATIGAGARWSDVVPVADAHGLTPIAGSSANVGVAGYLLGGGLGPFARSHGYSSDLLESLTVVTGTGEVVEASADEHPDLFWALRGGKVGLGVVTQVRLRLVAMPELYAGTLFFGAEHIDDRPARLAGVDAHRGRRDDHQRGDRALPTARGRSRSSCAAARSCCCAWPDPGDEAAGTAAAAPLRALAPAFLDTVGVLPAARAAEIHNDPGQPGPGWVRGMLLDRADDELADAWLGLVGADATTPFMAAELRHVAGATGVDVPGGSAVSGRGSAFVVAVASGDPSRFAELPAAADAITEALGPWASTEVNPNFSGTGTAVWEPAAADRLAQVRQTYDPAGVFA